MASREISTRLVCLFTKGGVIICLSHLPAVPTHPGVPMAYINIFHFIGTPQKIKI